MPLQVEEASQRTPKGLGGGDYGHSSMRPPMYEQLVTKHEHQHFHYHLSFGDATCYQNHHHSYQQTFRK